eukprot:10770224-Alexandrium_andersonii.AAC.1
MRCSFLRIAAALSVVRFALALRPRFARALGARALLGAGARHRCRCGARHRVPGRGAPLIACTPQLRAIGGYVYAA